MVVLIINLVGVAVWRDGPPTPPPTAKGACCCCPIIISIIAVVVVVGGQGQRAVRALRPVNIIMILKETRG